MPSDDYARHLAKLHGAFEAPGALIREAARQVSGRPIVSRRRIVHGEANEVYALTFDGGLEVILRIARRAEGIFEKERWAIDRCRRLGVLAPRVLSIQRLETDGEALEICILEKLPGERLSDSLSLPRETLRAIVRQVGEQLSRMNAVGWPDLGEGARFFEHGVDAFAQTTPDFVKFGVGAGLDPVRLERACREVAAVVTAPSARRLTHNDTRACHVLAHEGRLSGLIDFGQVSMDSPVNEFAKWDFWEAPALPVAWLEEGYGDRSLFDGDYRQRFEALRIANGLWALRWYALTGYAGGVEAAAGKLRRYLAGP